MIDWSVVLGWAIGVAVGVAVLGVLAACILASKDSREEEKAEARRLETIREARLQEHRLYGVNPEDAVAAFERAQQAILDEQDREA